MSGSTNNPYDMNGANFNPEMYLQKMTKVRKNIFYTI